VLWLARELSTNSVWDDRIIVVVSHDRYFLDDACTDTLHISGVVCTLCLFACHDSDEFAAALTKISQDSDVPQYHPMIFMTLMDDSPSTSDTGATVKSVSNVDTGGISSRHSRTVPYRIV
jgi:hypothetical protein